MSGRRKSSFLASVGKAVQQLTPNKKKDGRSSHRGRRRSRSSGSSSGRSRSSYDDESSYSDLSGSDYSSSYAEDSKVDRRSRRSRRSNNHRRRHRSRSSRRGRDSRRRGRRRGNDRYSPDSYRTPQRHQQNPNVIEDDSAQMIELLTGIFPFYGKGDAHSDAVVIDTLNRLPPHALEMQDVDGNTLLLLACQSGAYSLLHILFSRGCNVNARNNVGASSLHFACFVDTFSTDAALALIQHGAISECSEHEFGCTPLHWAAFSGHSDVCSSLCRAGANPKTLDKNGSDPIYYATQNGHHDCVQLLESFASSSRVGSVPSLSAAGTAGAASSPNNTEWVRCLDGSTGSSFYHNRDTGESLWGDEYRKADQSTEPSGADIKSPPHRKDEPSGSESEDKEKDSIDLTPDEIDLDAPLHGTTHAAEVTKIVEKRILTAIKEDLHESSSCEQIVVPDEPAAEKESELADIIEDLFETSSVEEENEPAQIDSQQKVANESTKLSKESALNRSNSWDVDLYGEAEEKSDGAAASTDTYKTPVPSSTNNVDPSDSITRNQSFEDRIQTLHQNMESQLMHRLQHIEEKITQQNAETSLKASSDDSSKLKENIAEMAMTVVELRTEVGSKDLEILSLKQQIVKLETKQITDQKQSMHVSVGEGNVHDNSLQEMNEQLATAQAQLHEATDEIALLKEQANESAKLLHIANERYGQAQRHLEIAEQLAEDEKASRTSMMAIIEQAQTGEHDSASHHQQEKLQAEQTISQLRESLTVGIGERSALQQELEATKNEMHDSQSQAMKLELEMKKKVLMHETSLAELKARHTGESDRLKEELNTRSLELASVQAQLKDAKMARMELLVAKDEAVDAMEGALQKARLAESKLQEMTDLVSQTQELRNSNERLHTSLQDETEKRKVLHNTLEDMKGRIRVYVRVRPLSTTELKANYVNVMTKEDERTCVLAPDKATASELRAWEFDKIFYGSNTDGNTQENVMKDTNLLIQSSIDGFNVCIFAYGQTGSGKTYTMVGSGDDGDPNQGLAPRVAHELFRKLKEKEDSHHVEVSTFMLELYTDKLCDLLGNKNDGEFQEDLKIRLAEHTSSGLVEVDGAKIERVSDAKELMDVFDRAMKGRASSSTKMNAESSRSHAIMTIVLSMRNRRTGKVINGKLTLVDLAGSERVSKSGATGQQLKEAQSINKSLSALGDVIGALTSGGRQHIPYRNHPLTMLMSDSIGGNSKTLLFVCCSPADYNRKETANSLDFAARCRKITNNVETSKASKGSSDQIRALRAELNKIKREKGTVGAAKRRSTGMRRPGL